MTRKRWFRAFICGLLSTLFIALYLSLSAFKFENTPEHTGSQRRHMESTKQVIPIQSQMLWNSSSLHNMNIPIGNKINYERVANKADSGYMNQSQILEEKIVDNVLETIHMAIACCLNGQSSDKEQITLTQTFLKSLFTFNRDGIHLHIFVTPNYTQPVRDLLSKFQTPNITFQFTFYAADMPEMGNIVVKDGPIWTKNVTLATLFKPCSAQRLFLPYNLENLEKVIYIDTDTLILAPLMDLWKRFKEFNASQIYGMSFIAKHRGFYDVRPYYQPYKGLTGHNAGVMLMHLKRMREIGWYNITMDIINKLSGPKWAYASDQDILNYYNGLYPENLYEMPCVYNWRWSYCRSYNDLPQECEQAHYEGISVIHGVSGTFFRKNNFIMRVYRIFAKFSFGSSIEENIIVPIKNALVTYKDHMCAPAAQAFYTRMETFIHES